MNTLLTVVEGPVLPELSLGEMQQAVEVTVVELGGNEASSSASESHGTVKLTASVGQTHALPLPVSYDWGSRSHVQIFVLVFATAVGLYLCYLLTMPFLNPIIWSLSLAVICVPLQRCLESIIRNRNVAAAVSVFTIGLVVLILVSFVGQRLVSEASSGAQMVNARIESGEWRKVLEGHPRLAPLGDWIEQQNLPQTVKYTITWLSTEGMSVVRGSVIEVMSLLLTFYLLFYFLRDRSAGISALRSVVPLTRSEMDRLLARIADTIHATVYGTLTVAAVQGFLGGLMFWWLGLQAPLLWGVVMGLLAIIPILGAFIVWIPAALLLAIDGHWGQAIVLSLWGLIVVGTIDNLLRPILVGKRLKQHTVLAFISLVGGILVFGPAGLVLGPVALTTTAVLLEIWPHPAQLPDAQLAASQLAASQLADEDAISRFENEGGRPASTFCARLNAVRPSF